MDTMFAFTSAFNQNIGSWIVSGVTSMNSIFESVIVFNGDLSTWNVSGVTNMDYMFYGASAFTNHDLSGWVVTQAPTHVNFSTGWGSGNTEPIW